MDKVLKIYKLVNDVETPFPNSTLQAELYSFQYDCKRMGNAPTLTGTIMYPLCLDNLWNDKVFVLFNNEKYFIDHTPSSSYSNADTRYKHDVTFVSERNILENIIFTDGIETEFHFFGDLKMLVDRLNAFLTSRNLGYNIVLDDTFATDEKDVDIQSLYVSEVLNKGFELFNIPYYFDGKTIHFGYYQSVISQVFKYGVGNALLSINKENSNNSVITRITGVGSSDNLPYYYPNFNESGEHDITTTPSGYQNQISKLNYLKIDPYTNLRNGGWAKYHKACVNPIGDEIDNVTIQVLSTSNSGPIQTFSYDWKQNITATSVDGSFVAKKEVSINIKIIQPIKNNISISNILIARPDYGTIDYQQKLEVISIKGTYTPTTDFFPKEEDVIYTTNDTEILINPQRLYDLGIVISLKANVEIPVNKDGSVLAYFNYNTNYFIDKYNGYVNDEKFYSDYDKMISYPDGIRTYRKTFKYKVTREVAGYSTVYLNSIFEAVFSDSKGEGITEWNFFPPSDANITVKDSDGNAISHWLDSKSRFIYFRNTTSQRTTYTIEMTVLVQMSTPDNANAYGVRLYYTPLFARDERPYDYWKFHDGKEIKYDICGIKFANKNTIPDGLKVNFSKTKNWIDPKPNLMPSVFRNTKGLNIWYNAVNNRYKDENGNFISFVNPYNPNNPKEHISDPKNDIKPTIVGVKNTDGERIDQIYKIYFNPDDNNEEWITDEDGNSQELKHSFFFVRLRKMDFNLFDHALEKGEMTISMTSGHCGGCNFTIMVDDETQRNTVQVDENGSLLTDEEGNVIFGTPIERQQDTSQYEVWIALRKEEDSYGVIMPDFQANLVPVPDDTFVFTNILLPNEYIKKAERKLEQELFKELKENNTDKFNFSINFSRIFFAENQSILSQLNENSKLYIKYNDETNELYVNSYTYKIDSNIPLPEIKIELTDTLSVTSNSIQKSIDTANANINSINEKVNKEKEMDSKTKTESSNNINVVQTTGTSTTSVMSQKAVSDELAKIPEISQQFGYSTSKTMSQKTITEEFDKLKTIANIDVVQTTGNSTTSVMSQKAVSDELAKMKFQNTIPYFDAFEQNDSPNIIQGSTENQSGQIVFLTSSRGFATFFYKVDNSYYTNWSTRLLMLSDVTDSFGYNIPFSNKIFQCNNQQYIYNGATLIPISAMYTILPFKNVVTDNITITNETAIGQIDIVYSEYHTKFVAQYRGGSTYYEDWTGKEYYMDIATNRPRFDVIFVAENGEAYKYSARGFGKLVNSISDDIPLISDASYRSLFLAVQYGILIKGMKYRITNYVTTCNSSGSVDGVTTTSAGHPFDLIVTAISNNELDSRAIAILHEGDTYFANSELNKWEIKYDINNDTLKYKWADETNGKGVIYYMKDEFGNECPYDFKNIKYDDKYTFNNTVLGVDATVGQWLKCYENKIKAYKNSDNTIILNNIVFSNAGCTNNHFGNNCYSNSFVDYCKYISMGDNCYNNKFYEFCENISLGKGCYGNVFDRYCNSIRMGDNCYGNSILEYTRKSVIEDGCCLLGFDTEKEVVLSDTNKFQNLHIKKLNGLYFETQITLPASLLNSKIEIIIAQNSSGEIKIYNEADLVP